MGVARSRAAQDAVVRISRGVLRHRRAKAGADLHAFKDEVDPVAIEPLRPPQPRTHIVLLAHSLLGPLNREMVISGESLDPMVVLDGRCRKTSLVIAPVPCTPRKKCTMFSGRVRNGK